MPELRHVIADRTAPHRRLEVALVSTRLAAYVVALALLLPWGMAVAFFFVQMAVFGLCLGGSFAPSHKGMPIVPADMKIDFLRRQVMMSRNVRGGLLVEIAMGGLNFQIEHHLFPSMPRPNLRLVQPIVRAYCAEQGLGYSEAGLFESYGIVIDYLNNVGLRARGPFECPLAHEASGHAPAAAAAGVAVSQGRFRTLEPTLTHRAQRNRHSRTAHAAWATPLGSTA